MKSMNAKIVLAAIGLCVVSGIAGAIINSKLEQRTREQTLLEMSQRMGFTPMPWSEEDQKKHDAELQKQFDQTDRELAQRYLDMSQEDRDYYFKMFPENKHLWDEAIKKHPYGLKGP